MCIAYIILIKIKKKTHSLPVLLTNQLTVTGMYICIDVIGPHAAHVNVTFYTLMQVTGKHNIVKQSLA